VLGRRRGAHGYAIDEGVGAIRVAGERPAHLCAAEGGADARGIAVVIEDAPCVAAGVLGLGAAEERVAGGDGSADTLGFWRVRRWSG
jgi:hypothetical protein